MTAAKYLTPEYVRSVLDYCPETGLIAWKASGREAGYIDGDGHRRIKIRQQKATAARVAWAHYYGVMPSRRLRYVNGNVLDLRISNIREASPYLDMGRDSKPRNTSCLGFGFQTMRAAVRALSDEMSCADIARLLNISKSTVYNYRWEDRNPEKRLAHRQVEYALRWNDLEREPCANCGADIVHAHHHDYKRPLDVTWLCVACHKQEHAQ